MQMFVKLLDTWHNLTPSEVAAKVNISFCCLISSSKEVKCDLFVCLFMIR